MPEGLVGQIWFGMCPECPKTEMAVNEADLFECLRCHLQIHIVGGPTIMPEKGTGKFIAKGGCMVMAMDVLKPGYGCHIQEDCRVAA